MKNEPLSPGMPATQKGRGERHSDEEEEVGWFWGAVVPNLFGVYIGTWFCKGWH